MYVCFYGQSTINYFTNKKENKIANKKVPNNLRIFNVSMDPSGYVHYAYYVCIIYI